MPSHTRPSLPHLLLPEDMNEKGDNALPTIIVTPSSPTSVTDFYVHFIPPPNLPSQPSFFSFRLFRSSPPIALPITSQQAMSMTAFKESKSKSRRTTLMLLLAIPLFLIALHILINFFTLAMHHDSVDSAPHPDSIWAWISGRWSAHADLPNAAPVMPITSQPSPTIMPPS